MWQCWNKYRYDFQYVTPGEYLVTSDDKDKCMEVDSAPVVIKGDDQTSLESILVVAGYSLSVGLLSV